MGTNILPLLEIEKGIYIKGKTQIKVKTFHEPHEQTELHPCHHQWSRTSPKLYFVQFKPSITCRIKLAIIIAKEGKRYVSLSSSSSLATTFATPTTLSLSLSDITLTP